MMEFLNSMRGEPNYHGSLERLPLAPVRGKPPPYASRRQQSRRGGALKGIRGLSSSTGDLTSSSRSRTNSSTSNDGDWEDWGGGGGGGGGGAGDLGIPLNPRDMSDPPIATPTQPHHQRHGSVSYSYVELTSDDGNSDCNPSRERSAPTAPSTPQPQHQRHGSVSNSYVELTSDDGNSDRSPSRERSALTATSTPQPQHQRHGSVTYSYVELTSDDRNSDHSPSRERSAPTATSAPQPQHQRHGSVSYSYVALTSDDRNSDRSPSHERSALTASSTPQPQHQRHGSEVYSTADQTRDTRNSDNNPGHERSALTATPTHPQQHQGSVSYNSYGTTSEPSEARHKTNGNTEISNTSPAQQRHGGREGREQSTRSVKTQQEEKQGNRNTNANRSQEKGNGREGREQITKTNKTQQEEKQGTRNTNTNGREGREQITKTNKTQQEEKQGTRNTNTNGREGREQITKTNKTQQEEKQGTRNTNTNGREGREQITKTNKTQQEEKQGTRNTNANGRGGREQITKTNKTQQEEKQGTRNTNANRSQERARAKSGDTSDPDTASPASTLERRPRSGSVGNTKSLKNYRELAAIPDHTLVKWNRSKSMSDVFTGDDDAKEFEDKDGTNEGRRRRAASYSDVKDTVAKDREDKDKMKHRERYKDAGDKEGRIKDARRHIPSYKDAKDATGEEGRSENETRHTAQSPSLRCRSEGQEVKDAGGKDGVIHVARPILVRGKDEYQLDYVKEDEVTMQRAHHIVLSSSSSSSSSSPSFSNPPLIRQSDRGSDGEGVFVATPVFLEGSPTSSPPPLAPSSSSSAAHQDSRDEGAGQDPLKREKDTTLSTLRREILHLTRLKEEIEQNLIKSQVELKKQVSGLREERGGLEAEMEERERRLQAQGEEIKDLKDTISQLQTLVLASDGEVRLQRQASDLLEQLREEKRHRLEERKELQREVRALTSRLQEKEAQLQKYKSDPALSSWGSGGLGGLVKGAVGTWKTSLPDVRREPSPNSFSTSLAEKRRSISSQSDSSDDSHSTVISSTSRTSRAKDNVSGRLTGSALKSYKAVESLDKPYIAPVKDSRMSGKLDKAPVEGRPRGGNGRLDKAVDSFRKSYIAPVSDYRVNRASTRRETTAEPYGELGKAPVEGRQKESYVGLDKPVDSFRKSYIVPVSDYRVNRASTRPGTASGPYGELDKAPVKGRQKESYVGLDKPVDSFRKSYIAPVSDYRVNRASTRLGTAAAPLGKSDKAPVEGRPKESYVGSDKPVDSFVKSYITPVSDYRVNEAPTRPSGKLNKAPLGEGRPRSTPLWSDKAVEVSKKSDTATMDSVSHAVPLRLDRPWESSRNANRRPTSRTDPDVDCSAPSKSSVATLDLAPTSLTAPLGDAILSDTVEGRRYAGDGSGKARVRTTIYLQLGDYTGSGGGREGDYEKGLKEEEDGRSGGYQRGLREGRGTDWDSRRLGINERGLGEGGDRDGDFEGGGGEGEYRRSGDFERGLREGEYRRSGDFERGLREGGGGDGVYRRSGDFERGDTDWDYTRRGGYERGPGEGDYIHSRGYEKGLTEGGYGRPAGSNGDYLESENYAKEPKETPQNLVGKSTTPLVHLHHLHHTGQLPQPHVLRPVAPPPPQNTTRLHNAPPQVTREQFRERPPQPLSQVRSGDVEVEAGSRTSWMYKPVEGSGGAPAEEKRRREKVENGRGVEYGRREREPSRGVDYGRRKDQELRSGLESGRGETEAERGMECGRRTNLNPPHAKEGGRRGTESPRGVEDWRNQASELPRSNSIASSVSEAGKGTQATSYIAATIHCLHNIAPLRHFFTEEFRALGVRSELARAVSGVFVALETGRGNREAIQRLRDAVGHRDKIFLLHQDPPAADFLPCLLAWLHSDLAPETHPQGPPASSVVSRVFHGLRESLIVCPTRGEVLSVAMESFNFLTLSVPGEGAWTLQELLVRRFQPQEMAWQCGLCGRRHPCSHQPRLLQPPHVLVLYLRRPSSGAAAARVLFPEGGLALQLYHQHQKHHQHLEARTFRSPEYQLAGVVTREGGESSSVSHHSAFYRGPEKGVWSVWGEQRTAAVSRREVLSQQAAHLLFYTQQEEESQQVSGSSRVRGKAARGGSRDGRLDTGV